MCVLYIINYMHSTLKQTESIDSIDLIELLGIHVTRVYVPTPKYLFKLF